MHIFYDTEDFFGRLDKAADDSLLSLLRLARQIRLRLGKKGYLLANYLSLVLER